jgi:TRAP-type C4-dicarboxylate transport system permease small subunit
MKIVKALVHLASRVSNYLILASYLAFAAATLATLTDIFLRYIFGKPILGVIELNECLMPAIVFMGLAATQKYRGHIRVTLMLKRLQPRFREVLDLLAYVLGLVFIFIMAIVTWQDALHAYQRRESVMVGMDILPIWWSKFFVPIGLWAFSLQYLSDIVVQTARWLGWDLKDAAFDAGGADAADAAQTT